jgi:hypothetical protein
LRSLTTESIKGSSLALECVYDIERSDSLSLGVFSVGDCITDNVLEKSFEHSTGLFVDEARDTLDTTTTSETADSGLGDSLDVVSSFTSS